MQTSLSTDAPRPSALRWALFGIGCLLLAWVGWQVIRQISADQAADRRQWAAALAWNPAEPRAMLGHAADLMARDRLPEAALLLRQLIAREPLMGEAYRQLAQIEERQGAAARARRLHEIAVRRAPRDLPSQAWAIQDALDRGNHAAALARMDELMRLRPAQQQVLLPLLAQLAVDPAFAGALAATLGEGVPWRHAMLQQLTSSDGQAAGQVMAALHRKQPLPQDEFELWIGWLMDRAQWGEAYGYWAGRAVQRSGRLPLAYNGDFAEIPSNTGFDWRLRPSAGTTTRFESDPRGGHVALIEFSGRSVARAELELPVLLSPGKYRLRLRQRAQQLRSEQGLAWEVSCMEGGAPLARIENVAGTFAWRAVDTTFTVPATKCHGQWLRLVNPLPAGRAQRVSGQLWADDVTFSPVTGSAD